MSGRISFIGAGPGAADLITVRGARRIAEADVVVWTANLVAPECIQEHARADAELVDSSRLTREQAVEIYRRAERDKLAVARVHSGDSALWGDVQDQYDACVRMAVEVEIVPGVATFSAAAATVGRELTVPEVAQSLVVTRLEDGKHPMPAGESVREFARHGTTMALHLAASRAGQLVEELRAGGYADDVPVLVAYKVSWPDEVLLRTELGELEKTVKQHKLWRSALFLVGRSLAGSGSRSRTYSSSGQSPAYRRPSGSRRSYRSREDGGSERAGAGSAEPAHPSPSETAIAGPFPTPRAGAQESSRSESDVAWWAVRNWQDTARGAVKSAATRRVTPAQQGLFVGESELDQSVIERSVELGAVGVAVVHPAAADHAGEDHAGADELTESKPTVESAGRVESAEQVESVEQVEPAEPAVESPAEVEPDSAGAVQAVAEQPPAQPEAVDAESVGQHEAGQHEAGQNGDTADEVSDGKQASQSGRRTRTTKAAPKTRSKGKSKATGSRTSTARKSGGKQTE